MDNWFAQGVGIYLQTGQDVKLDRTRHNWEWGGKSKKN